MVNSFLSPPHINPNHPINSFNAFITWWWSINFHDFNKSDIDEKDYEFSSLTAIVNFLSEKLKIDIWLIAEVTMKPNSDERSHRIVMSSENLVELIGCELPLSISQLNELDKHFYDSNLIYLPRSFHWKEILDFLTAKGIIITYKTLFDKDALIIFGHSNHSNSSEEIDCFDTITINFIESIIGIFEIGYKTGRSDEAVRIYKKTKENKSVFELVGASGRLLKTQELIRRKRNHLNKKQEFLSTSNKIEIEPTIFKNSFFDEVMSIYIRTSLWIIEKEKYNKPNNVDWLDKLCQLYPEYGIPMQNIPIETKDKALSSKDIFKNASNEQFGFYISLDYSNLQWIAVGPECRETILELRNIYDFIISFLKLEVSKNALQIYQSKTRVGRNDFNSKIAAYEESVDLLENHLKRIARN